MARRIRLSPTATLDIKPRLAPAPLALVALVILLAGSAIWWRHRKVVAEPPPGKPLPVPGPAAGPTTPPHIPPTNARDPGQDTSVQNVVPPAQDPWEPDPPERLVEAVAARKAGLVIGAGVSEQSGLLTSTQLILQLVQRLGPRVPKTVLALIGEDPTEQSVAAIAQQSGGTAKLLEAVISAVPREAVVDLLQQKLPTEPSPLHGTLARLPWKAVVDLNLDDLMAMALASQRPGHQGPVPQVTVSDSQDGLRALRSSENVLFRPYGAHDQPTTIALTAEDMRRQVSRAPDFQRTVSSLLQSQSFLLLGLTAEAAEQFLYAFAPEQQEGQPRHHLLLPRDPLNAVRLSSLARFGVTLLEYDPQPDGSGPARFCRALQDRVRERESAFDPAATAARFHLSPDRVSRIRLVNIGPFEEIELSVSDGLETDVASDPAGAHQSPWWVLFGGNGVGKSTVLRALAVALAGESPASVAAGRRLLKADAPNGLIEVQVGAQVLRTRIQSERSNVLVSSSQKSPVELRTMLALGFPALRGVRTADPTGPTSRNEIREPEPADLDQLIASEVDGRLADFKQWLVNTLTSAERDPRAATMRALLNDLIREIIPGRIDALAPLRPGDFVIRVQTPEGEVPFDELSQGMASIFNWVGLLTQRLFTICKTSERPQDEPAIVIIDEIDAHLHPEWQRRLVPLTRKFFPNVQMIATSHSPLLAGSLRVHEMAVLARDPDTSVIAPMRHSATYGLMSQDIMTSGVFAMATDRNPEVERLIGRYFRLYEARSRTAEEELELERLRTELERYGFGSLGEVDTPIVEEGAPRGAAQALRARPWIGGMIKVARPPVTDPAISPIVAAAGPARQALLDAYADGRRPAVVDARYRAYKAALMKAFHGKCAYCDSFIDDNQPGHVEHYRPKKRVRNTDHSKIEVEYPGFGRIEHLGYFWLAYDWSNLLPACDLCNTYNKRDGVGMGKGDRFPVRGARAHLPGEEDSEEPLLIDPTRQDPGVHLSFARDGLVRGVTEEGEETVRLLGLNLRERLPRNRALAYDAAKHKLARFLNADVPKDELLKLRDQINALWEGCEEHTAHARLAIEDIRAHFLLLGVPVPMPLPALV